jgi:hypothetical protein
MQPNPYAPPASDGAPLPSGIVFSEEGVLLVNSLARWMHGLGWIYATGCVLFGLGSLLMIANLGLMGLALAVVAALLWIGGSLLRDAGAAFERGVGADDEMTIGQGFRRLRTYLVLVGVLAILGLLQSLFEAANWAM